jgi:hypothetical protein
MINLYYNYFKHPNPERAKEIDFCKEKNLQNKLLNVILINHQDRPTFDFYFKKINETTGPDDINIICNSDIFFDDTISLTSNMPHNTAYALCRWNYISPSQVKFYDKAYSQDVWIFKGPIKNINANFHLGYPRCDQRIAHEIRKAGYLLYGPSRQIKAYHVHNVKIWNYSAKNIIQGPGEHVLITNIVFEDKK